ncbi:MAG TPA: hypothetical protein VEC06_15520 [Paucimonas sp.]|nr:hypothetical protein [Paucimonas sp.]
MNSEDISDSIASIFNAVACPATLRLTIWGEEAPAEEEAGFDSGRVPVLEAGAVGPPRFLRAASRSADDACWPSFLPKSEKIPTLSLIMRSTAECQIAAAENYSATKYHKNDRKPVPLATAVIFF